MHEMAGRTELAGGRKGWFSSCERDMSVRVKRLVKVKSIGFARGPFLLPQN